MNSIVKKRNKQSKRKGRQLDSSALTEVQKLLDDLPRRKELLIEALHLIQDRYHYLSAKHLVALAHELKLSLAEVYEVATFYTMYNLAPVGNYFFQVCTTTPCMLRGAYKLVDVCKNKISKNESEISKDGEMSWMEVECLGACVNAPMIQINDDYFEDLDEKKLEKIIENIKQGKKIEPGSYKGRKSSEPENNRNTLMDSKNA